MGSFYENNLIIYTSQKSITAHEELHYIDHYGLQFSRQLWKHLATRAQNLTVFVIIVH